MELTNIGEIKRLFERHGFSFTKSLGQNFLVNPSVCPRIAEFGGADKSVCALEIGTGVGVLTKELALRAKKVVAVEIDEGLKPILAETLDGFDNISVVFGDVLKLDLKQLFADNFSGENVVVCANLPYYITSPVIMALLEQRLPIRSITVMVQKEAAERICAELGTRECGAISAAVRFFSVPKKLFSVSRGSFMPSPNVDSAVIRLDVHQSPLYQIDDEKLFFRLIKSAFAQRRKQLVNPVSAEFGIEKSKLKSLMEIVEIKPTARAEELKMEDFVCLYRLLRDNVNGLN